MFIFLLFEYTQNIYTKLRHIIYFLGNCVLMGMFLFELVDYERNYDPFVLEYACMMIE